MTHHDDDHPYTLLLDVLETNNGQILVSADDALVLLKNYARARCGGDTAFLERYTRLVDGAFSTIRACARET